MKLDRIRFAKLMHYLARYCKADIDDDDLTNIDNLIDIPEPETPEVNETFVYPSTVYELMQLMVAGTNKTEAIKVYRKLTGLGLKESKDEVEKCWSNEIKLTKKELYTKLNEWSKEKQLTSEQDNAIATFVNWCF